MSTAADQQHCQQDAGQTVHVDSTYVPALTCVSAADLEKSLKQVHFCMRVDHVVIQQFRSYILELESFRLSLKLQNGFIMMHIACTCQHPIMKHQIRILLHLIYRSKLADDVQVDLSHVHLYTVVFRN